MPHERWASRHLGALVGAALALLALGPLLVHRGYVLVGDMVFLPRPPLTRTLLGLSAVTPRAVPSDLVAAAASHLLPGDVVQKCLLAAIFILAASGAARLLDGHGLAAQASAATLLAWNPYVAERLALGQWAVLLGYAALPWVVVASFRVRAGQGGWSLLVLALAVAALTPTGGLVATGVALAVLLPGRRAVFAVFAGLVMNGPWLVPALLRPTGLPRVSEGNDAFAAHADTPLGVLGSVLSLGGTWASESVPRGRDAAGLVPVTLLLLAAVAVGTVLVWRHVSRGLVLAAGVSVLVAVAGATPVLRDGLRALVEGFPAAALLRDGPRYLGPLAVLSAVAFGLVVEAVGRALPRRTAWFAAAVPVLVLPGLALALGGRLGTADYPPGWAEARAVVTADSAPGAVLVLPWAAYRAPRWNGGRTVLDPAGKAFDRRVVVDDVLPVGDGRTVGDLLVPGEDPLAATLAPVATGTGSLLAVYGVRWVLVERPASSALEARLAGAVQVMDTPDLALWRLPATSALVERTPPVVPVLLADVLAIVVVLGSAAGAVRSSRT